MIPLGPGKFYGSSLPRPRFYTDVKLNSERVDPPVPVLDPLLSWATEAHWSMGGLSFNRLRLQGRIEGNIERLRVQREKLTKNQEKSSASPNCDKGKGGSRKKRASFSPSPPPAPIASKRRRYMALIDDDDETEEEEVEEKVVVDDNEGEDEEEEEEQEVVLVANKKKPVRKLYEEFNRVADKRRPEGSNALGGNEVMKVVGQLNREPSKRESPRKRGVSGGSIRASPRLAKAAEMDSGPKTRASRRLVKRG